MIGVPETLTLTMDLSFPSELGYERVAREAVAAFARRLGFDAERIEDLKTALGEACINAIEHGNRRVPGLHVAVSCTCNGELLTVEIRDTGVQPYVAPTSEANIEQKLKGLAPLRGMGLMMISQLVDEAGFAESDGQGNLFRLVLRCRSE